MKITFNTISLQSQFCRTPRIQVGCTHARTIEKLNNAFLLSVLGNALLWSQFVLGWVQRNSNFGSSDRRLYVLKGSRLLRLGMGLSSSPLHMEIIWVMLRSIPVCWFSLLEIFPCSKLTLVLILYLCCVLCRNGR